jgi:hypothetical protein
VAKEGLGTIGSSGGGKWDNFWPSGGAVYNGEKMGKTMGAELGTFFSKLEDR